MHPPPLLLRFLGTKIAEDPPVGESEGVGHGIANVGPAEHGERDAKDGVEYGHHFGHCSLWSNVTVAW